MTERYRFGFSANSVYQHVAELLLAHAGVDRDVVVDLGCGYGAIAEELAGHGLTYVGFDADEDAVADLRKRGFEAWVVDLGGGDEAVATIEGHLEGRALCALTMLDSLEHLTDGPALLARLHRLAGSHGSPVLVVSVPNVTHLDIAAKLLLGRWDVTETGLLDRTHVTFFSGRRLTEVMAAAGWHEVAAHDFELRTSDQHFPAEAAALTEGAPLQQFLRTVREEAAPYTFVNQFVRAYLPAPATRDLRGGDEAAPFATVLMRTRGNRRETLQDALLSLAAQTCDDFEVLLLVHRTTRDVLGQLQFLVDAHGEAFSRRVRVVPVDEGGRGRPLNVGVELARGDYLVFLDDDDIVFAHWIEQFQQLAREGPGRVLRTVPSMQHVRGVDWDPVRRGYEAVSRPTCPWPVTFDVLDHIFENLSPFCCYALPRSAFVDLGVRFDESLPVLEDWDVLLRVGLWCGVVAAEEVTSLYRWWERGGDSSTAVHTTFEWSSARSAVISKLDRQPLLLPPRAVSSLRARRERLDEVEVEARQLRDRVADLERDRAAYAAQTQEALRQLDELRHSTSWKAAFPLRAAGRLARSFLRRLD